MTPSQTNLRTLLSLTTPPPPSVEAPGWQVKTQTLPASVIGLYPRYWKLCLETTSSLRSAPHKDLFALLCDSPVKAHLCPATQRSSAQRPSAPGTMQYQSSLDDVMPGVQRWKTTPGCVFSDRFISIHFRNCLHRTRTQTAAPPGPHDNVIPEFTPRRTPRPPYLQPQSRPTCSHRPALPAATGPPYLQPQARPTCSHRPALPVPFTHHWLPSHHLRSQILAGK